MIMRGNYMIKSRTLPKGLVKELFHKANLNAIAGYPISYSMNLAFLQYFPHVLAFFHGNYLLATFTFGTPYYVTSVVRQFGIDFSWFKYGIHLDPKYYFDLLLKQFKKPLIEDSFKLWLDQNKM